MTDSNENLTPQDLLKDALIRSGVLEDGSIQIDDLDDNDVLCITATDILLKLSLNNRLLEKRLKFIS